MNRVALGAGLLVWVGATLLLSQWGRLSRPGLAERLRPYSPAGRAPQSVGGILSVESLRDLVRPLLRLVGDRLAALFGVSEPLAAPLRRVHSELDVTAFRVRQMASAGAALLVGALVAGLGAPTPLAILVVLGAPALVFLVFEQSIARASERWQESLARELPVVEEQLAMLLNAGHSLGAGLAWVARRGQGCAARDLTVVVNRIRQGVAETDALQEWAAAARVQAVERLVGVLALGPEAPDLGSLVSAEARQCRRDLQRRNIETMERRAQQVWIPVTVATLVPGVILLAVPFLSALRLFANA